MRHEEHEHAGTGAQRGFCVCCGCQPSRCTHTCCGHGSDKPPYAS